ncbi:MAG TPA: transcription elongation factor GreA [Bacilli bacterium]|jgi:transcription elongation factor GreA|nr:transcription elongation factor GreA [Acholeplasmataceae bacterium]HNZ78211.1 transcription elongation factor GreA [Bacilli bacterium]HOD60786.1 transcription elongation factor GreA [Bacilli bacterium]HOE06880.1 transcription elongation factor GreA [Bacilli bacterium]HOH61728.1 transcription elongation factor GreA [Bacilli bacterium]
MNGKHQLTIEGLKKCKLELEKLKTVDRPRIVEALKEARAQGDLSENAEYDAARDEQANIEARIKELENIIKNSDVIEINKKTTSNLGKKITVEYDDGFVAEYTLVGSLEADPSKGKISNESPLGKEIINRKKGDRITIRNESGEEFDIIIRDIKQ